MKKWVVGILVWLVPTVVMADIKERINIRTEDGTTNTYPYQARFTNGTVTDHNDGTVSIAISTGSGGGGGTPSPPNYSVQVDSNGAFGGSSNFTWDGSSVNINNVSITSFTSVSTMSITNAYIDGTASTASITYGVFGSSYTNLGTGNPLYFTAALASGIFPVSTNSVVTAFYTVARDKYVIPSTITQYGGWFESTWDGPANSSSGGGAFGSTSRAINVGTTQTTNTVGQIVYGINQASGTVSNALDGTEDFTFNSGGGVANTQRAIYAQTSTTGGSTTTFNAGIEIAGAQNGSGGITTANYGLYVDSQTIGGRNYGIFDVAANNDYLGGNLTVGNTVTDNFTIAGANNNVINGNASGHGAPLEGQRVTNDLALTNNGQAAIYGIDFQSVNSQSSSNVYGGWLEADWLGASSNPTAILDGSTSRAIYNGTTSLGYMTGSFNFAQSLTTGTVSVSMIGSGNFAENTGGGTAAKVEGVYTKTFTLSGSTTTNSYGIYIDSASIDPQSVVTTNYGIYVSSQIYGGTNYGIYSFSNNDVFTGSVTVSGFLQIGSFTIAQLTAMVPTAAGQEFYCSNCSTDSVALSTGTGRGALGEVGARGTFPH